MTRGSDNYETPEWVTEAFLRRYPWKPQAILEPCAGSGAIVRVLRRHYPEAHITAVEIREEERAALTRLADEVHIADFLMWQPPREYDLIISNPPYSLAQEIVERALSMVRLPIYCAQDHVYTRLAMLLRLGFLESEKRLPFWRKRYLNGLYVLANRPSFDGKGTDATAYGWFLWEPGGAQFIQVIGRDDR